MDEKPHTHVAWVKRYDAGRFQEWLEVGRGRLTDSSEPVGFEGFLNRMPLGGWNGYVQFLLMGVQPKDPEPTPKRPDR